MLESPNVDHMKGNCSWDMNLWKNSGGLHSFTLISGTKTKLAPRCKHANWHRCSFQQLLAPVPFATTGTRIWHAPRRNGDKILIGTGAYSPNAGTGARLHTGIGAYSPGPGTGGRLHTGTVAYSPSSCTGARLYIGTNALFSKCWHRCHITHWHRSRFIKCWHWCQTIQWHRCLFTTCWHRCQIIHWHLCPIQQVLAPVPNNALAPVPYLPSAGTSVKLYIGASAYSPHAGTGARLCIGIGVIFTKWCHRCQITHWQRCLFTKCWHRCQITHWHHGIFTKCWHRCQIIQHNRTGAYSPSAGTGAKLYIGTVALRCHCIFGTLVPQVVPTPAPHYGLWINLHFFTICIYKHFFLPMLLVFTMKCIKLSCSLPHNHYCCSLPSPVCLPHLLICTCFISSPIACPPSSVLCWCLSCFFCCFFLFYFFVICYTSKILAFCIFWTIYSIHVTNCYYHPKTVPNYMLLDMSSVWKLGSQWQGTLQFIEEIRQADF